MSDKRHAVLKQTSPTVVGIPPSDAMTTFEFECPHCGKVQIVQTSAYNDNFKGVDVACLPEGHRYDLVQRETGVGGIPGL